MFGPYLRSLSLLSVLVLLGCGGGGDGADGGADATLPDATADSAMSDAATPDGAVPDATTPDATTPDATTPDGAAPDGAVPDGGGACAVPTVPAVRGEDIAAGETFSSPVFVAQAPGDDATLFVVEQPGRIMLVRAGAVLATPFLDIRGTVRFGGEQGLLGLAFHPDYATNGRFFVFYTSRGSRRDVVAEYHHTTGDTADATEVAQLVSVADSESNHNGGMLAFGPDGFLYVGMGDEGGGGDDHGTIGNALDTSNLFGSLLRLDTNNGPTYAAAGNPFSGVSGLPQIWAYGLRNPWRFSFDSATGDLYIGDVGQSVLEEVDFLPAGAAGGSNFGWRAYEGDRVFDAALTGRVDPHIEPILAYRHFDDSEVVTGCSISGGYVYRGAALPALTGAYFYGDFCTNQVAVVRYCEDTLQGPIAVTGLGGAGADGIASFGQDHAGEVYVVFQGSGHVRRIVPE